MIKVTEFGIKTYCITHIVLYWEIEKTFEHLSDYMFEVYRAESPDGEYVQIASMIDTYEFQDSTLNTRSMHREFFYKLRVWNMVNFKEETYGPITMYKKHYPIPSEIIRRNDLLLKNYVGRLAYVLKARTFGEQCTECWDHIKKTITKTHCRTCFRVGYTGGYHTPIPTLINTNPDEKYVQLTQLGEIQHGEEVMWLSNYPLITERDMIVFADSYQRFRVVRVAKTEMLGALVHQTITTVRIPHSDVEYEVSVPEIGQIPIIRRVAMYENQIVEGYDHSTGVVLENAANATEIQVFADKLLVEPDEYTVVAGILYLNEDPDPPIERMVITTTVTEEQED